MSRPLLQILQKETDVDVIQAHDRFFRQKVQASIAKRRFIVMYTLDNMDHYMDNLKYLKSLYDKYVLCTSGPFDDANNMVCLDSLIQVQGQNKDLEITHSPDKGYDFLLLPGKDQIWRLELISMLLEKGLLENSLWSIINRSGAIVPIKEKHLPREYELEGFDLESVIQNPSPINQIVVKKQYVDTKCSIICETSIAHDRIYLTEKTWKPLLAGHPFIAQANPAHHFYLKRLGFKTFGSMWNEEFRSQTDIVKSCEIVKQMDAGELLSRASLITEHNRSHAMETSWIEQFHYEQLKKFPGISFF